MYTVFCLCVGLQARRGHQTPFTDGCEPSCGCWEMNSGPLEEQAVLLMTQSSIHPTRKQFLKKKIELRIRTKFLLIFIELYIFLCFPPCLSLSLQSSSMVPMLPIYSGDLAFFYFPGLQFEASCFKL